MVPLIMKIISESLDILCLTVVLAIKSIPLIMNIVLTIVRDVNLPTSVYVSNVRILQQQLLVVSVSALILPYS